MGAIEPTPFQSLLLGSLIFTLVYLYVTRLKAYNAREILAKQHGCQPPPSQPLRDPFFGLDLVYSSIRAIKTQTFLDSRRRHYEDYGDTFSSRLATVPTISTIAPENIKTVLSTNFRDYVVGSPRRDAFFPLLGNSVFLVDGTHWEHSRAFLRPIFSTSQIGDLVTLETHVSNLVRVIPRDASTVDVAELFLRYTADVTTDFMLGESIQSLSHPEDFRGDMMRAFRDAQAGGEHRFRLGKFAAFMPQPRFYSAIKRIHTYIDMYVDRALDTQKTQQKQQAQHSNSERGQKYSLLSELSKVTDDRKVLRDELAGIFFAGRDTTSALLSNIFFVLARQPQILARLHDEVDHLDGAIPTLEKLKSMKYLEACINESLRLYPVVPGNSRMAIKDTILPTGGGSTGLSPVLVPSGTLVIFHMFALHLQPSIWGPDATQFRPERWLEGGKKAAWTFLPFGGGPRNCIGQQFALIETGYTVVRLLQEFGGVESRDPEGWKEQLGATCCSANGVKVGLVRR